MSLTIPAGLAAVAADPTVAAWLERLPNIIEELVDRWQIDLDRSAPFAQASCSWVAPAVRRDGTHVVLKIGLPLMPSRHEIDGLRFWNGRPTVRLLEADGPHETHNALLLERCEPGTPLAELLPEPKQDEIIASLLRRLWRTPPDPHPFRPLSEVTDGTAEGATRDLADCPDAGLLREGIRLFQELPWTAPEAVLLATDLHAWNVLRTDREEWLVIDPMPFVGDPAYDATQHLLNCEDRLRTHPLGTVARMAELLEIDTQRLRWWMFARLAVMSRGGKHKKLYELACGLA
ncbi:MAG: aminoglycoside phosphotransferase family protein [Armatimonadota bacterium]